MTPQKPIPVAIDIVLVGAGHAHVQVLAAFGMQRLPGVRMTVIADRLLAPYSGMLPGCIAGDYSQDDIHIDVARLARHTGARLIHAAVSGFDRARKQVLFRDRPPVAYDLLSINVGITPDLSSIAGAELHAVPVKPIAGMLDRLKHAEAAMQDLPRAARVAVIGGGAAGIELALALAERSRRRSTVPAEISLFAGGGLAPTLNTGVQRRARRALAAAGIAIVEHDRVVAVEADRLHCSSGAVIQNDVAFVSTNAQLPDWLAATDLPKAENGGLAVRASLQIEDDDAVFAAGDCATMVDDPRPRAGVFAVRQGPVLARNLMAAARHEPLESYRPQRAYLSILRTGPASAIAGRGRYLAAEGAWVWRWKDRIDRDFMAMFRPPVVDPRDDSSDMRCGGCAAKVGPDPLAAALSRLPEGIGDPDIAVGLEVPDDAAVIAWGDAPSLVQSVDQFRSFIDDAFLFGRIAANHALNDIYAMGGVPHHALALATLPHGKPAKVAEELYQLLSGARVTLDAASCPLVGGHSSEGDTLALGLSVTGRLGSKAFTKTGARPGDHLILTKALGSGIVFAADMRASARASTVEAMLAEMLKSNQGASRLLVEHGVTAMTDVSGFGLLGHLAEMLGAGGGAQLRLDLLPLVEGVADLAAMGFASSLMSENRSLLRKLAHPERQTEATLALVCDPQTAGGLLAAVPPAQAGAVLAALRASGYTAAADIGAVTDSGTVQLV